MGRIAIYPGTFDPITNGHTDLIRRAVWIFDKVIVAVAENSHKNPLFSLSERLAMVKEATKDMPNVAVDSFNGLTVEYAKRKKVKVLLRGIRMVSDFEYEFQMALTNRHLTKEIETIFLMPSQEYSYISSKLLKEASYMGADISAYVSLFVKKKLQKRLKK